MRYAPFAALLMLASSLTGSATLPLAPEDPAEPLSLLTYNVHGLPWPIATDRPDELRAIGDRLAWLRQRHEQPSVVVLQEAFTADAARIGRIGGYRYAAVGPDDDERGAIDGSAATRGLAASANVLKGETEGKWEGSGLRLFSDFPIVAVSRMAFPSHDCAGFDCLANKGALLVTLELPGHRFVQIATTHLNSRAASGVPDARSIVAYRRQSALLHDFVARERNTAEPLILAGDFNMGQVPPRRAALTAAVAALKVEGPASGGEGLRTCLQRGSVDLPGDARYIIGRSRDFQFYYDGRAANLTPVQATIPFGHEADGSALSDHLGFVVRYAYAPAAAAGPA